VAMAEDLGFGGDPLDTAGIISSVDRGRRAALRATLLWIDDLYNYNQATRFKVKPSFPVSNGPGALMVPGMLWPGPSRTSDPDEIEIYSHPVRWPSLKVLRNVPPDTLLACGRTSMAKTIFTACATSARLRTRRSGTRSPRQWMHTQIKYAKQQDLKCAPDWILSIFDPVMALQSELPSAVSPVV
jgi:hypothetical protein